MGPANGLVSFSSRSQEEREQLNPIGAYSFAGARAPGARGGLDI